MVDPALESSNGPFPDTIAGSWIESGVAGIPSVGTPTKVVAVRDGNLTYTI